MLDHIMSLLPHTLSHQFAVEVSKTFKTKSLINDTDKIYRTS